MTPPILLVPEEKSPQEIEEKRRRQYERERARQKALEPQGQPSISNAPPSQRGENVPLRQSQEQIVKEQPMPPSIPSPQPVARESANPAPSTPLAQEARQTKETTKVETYTLTHFNAEAGRYETQEGQNKVMFQELDKIERIEPLSPQAVEAEKERAGLQNEREAAGLRAERLKAEVVKAVPLQQVVEPISEAEREKGEERKKDGEKAAEVVPDSRRAGPKEERKEETVALIRHALDEALDQNRPGLVVQTILDKREVQGPLDLLQFDERSVRVLQQELTVRIVKAKKERDRLEERLKGEKNAKRKLALQARLRKVLMGLAFYSKVKGMLGRVLGGFFGKLAGGLMQK